MALIIAFQNISGLSDVSDYKVDVYINDILIDGHLIVKGHKRNDGYKELIKKFIEQHYEL